MEALWEANPNAKLAEPSKDWDVETVAAWVGLLVARPRSEWPAALVSRFIMEVCTTALPAAAPARCLSC